MSRSIDPLDIRLGRLIRARRRAAGWSQAALGRRIGVSFQQVQKYESGANRVSAATLHALAAAFEVPTASFFDGLSGPAAAAPARDLAAELLCVPGGAELAEAFLAIRSPRVRSRLLALAGEIAGTAGAARRASA
ncbi:helix-turn-helix domain-containing protein [Caulobacter sp. NIBR2454]|uniref:helix-turn-helix domain-containing protein n=1 Tax=Caulobacter sp. NIBR2454 TaxID=3015996 RepID=UPI0022B7064E|nr:helix-turn-helix transcriptional regulator [Caulobacter sp. NIBR2454]